MRTRTQQRLSVLLAALLVLTGIYGCNPSQDKTTTSEAGKNRVTVYYLHQPKRCKTCIAVGEVAKETIRTFFAEELASGQLAFEDLDISREENAGIRDELQCTWSGLYIVQKEDTVSTVEDLTTLGFMYALNQPDTLEKTLIHKLNDLLKTSK